MRSLFAIASTVLLGIAGAALAAEKTVPTVLSAAAEYSTTERHTIIIQARVRLDNGCWSNPRFQRPDAKAAPDTQGVLPITVVADSSEGPDVMCAMHVTDADVPPLHWSGYPNRVLKALKVVGSREPVVVSVPGAGGTGN